MFKQKLLSSKKTLEQSKPNKHELDSLILQNLVSAKDPIGTNPNDNTQDDIEFLNPLFQKTQDDKDHLVQVR